MLAHSTEAIVLRTYDIAENDRILSVFTRDFGKIRGIALGCKRVKEGNLGWQDTGAHISVHVYEREGLELARFSRWQLLEHFQKSPKLPNLLNHMYVIELLCEFSSERLPNPGVFRLALAVLRSLSDSPRPSVQARYFEFWLLRLEGFWPGMSSCPSCNRPFSQRLGAFSPQSLRLYCRGCAPQGALPLSPRDFDLLETFSRLAPRDLFAAAMENSSLSKLETMAQTLILRHLEHDLKSYSLVKELAVA